MQLSIPLRGKQMKVDTSTPEFRAEVLTMGHAFVVRFGHSVVLAMVPADKNVASEVIFEMPLEVYQMFEMPKEPEKPAPNGTEATAEPEKPPVKKPETSEEAADYIAHYKERGWPKPSGAIYRLRDRKPGPDAAERVTATLEGRSPKATANKAAKATQ